MNMKKTALATAIALTMAGGGSAWAETTTVKGQFIADKLVVGGGETINLSLLGLDTKGEVDRFGESQGATIMAVVESDKGQILGGSRSPTLDPDPKDGYFTSDVKYVRLTQGVGRVSIYYPEEIVDREETKDTVTVYLQERVPTGEGGVDFVQIGHALDKTITIKPGVGLIPESIALSSFKAPEEGEGQTDDDRANGIAGTMTAGYSGAEITVIDPEFVGNLRKLDRAGSTIRLELLRQNGESIYNDTEKMVRGQAIFVLEAIKEAAQYNIVATVEEDETVNTTQTDQEGRLLFTDTLEVLPRRDVRGLKLSVDKEQIALLNKDNQDLPAKCASQLFPYDQLCQGTKLRVMVLDEFGNETTKTNSGLLNVVVNDTNSVVKSGAVKFQIDPGMGEGRPINPGDAQEDAVLGNHPSETLKAGTASLIAKIEGDNLNEIADAAIEEIQVLQNSLVAKPVEPDLVQTAGTDFDAFFVGLLNSNGYVLMTTGNPLPFEDADTEEKRPFTADPGLVVIENLTGDTNQSFRSPKTNIVQANFKTATSLRSYMLHDNAGKYAPVQAMAWAIKAADAVKVVKSGRSGTDDDPLKPMYVKVNNQFQLTLRESDFKLQDVFGNVLDVYGNTGTPDVGQFTVTGKDGGSVSYPNQATQPYGRPYPAGNGIITVTYGAGAAEATRHLEARFTKPGLEEKTLLLTVAIPKVPEEDDPDPGEPTPDEHGPIVTYIEVTEIPVNSEVALKVETLDEEEEEIVKGHSVRFRLNGLEGDTITPSVSELDWSDIKTRSEPLTATLTDEKCKAEGGQVAGGECEFPLTESECHDKGYIFTIQEQCREQSENPLASGEKLDLLKSSGQEVLVVNAGSKEGQFSLHFSYTDTNEIDKTLIFNVTREIVEPPPPVTEAECVAGGNYWGGEACKSLPEIGNPIPGKTTSGLVKPNGAIMFTSNAHFNGGVAVGTGGEFSSAASMELTAAGENVLFAGNIQFDAAHDGETVDIVVAVSYKEGTFGPTQWFSFDPTVGLRFWNLIPADLVTFMEHDVNKDENLPVTIYDGPLNEAIILPGTLEVYLAYRRENGEVHFNGQPITLHMQ